MPNLLYIPWKIHTRSRLLLTVLTTSFRPSKSRKRGGYMTSFMHVFNTNKVPQVVLLFLLASTHLGIKRSHRATPGRCGRPCWWDRPCTLPRCESKRLPLPQTHFEWIGFVMVMSVWSKGFERKHLDPRAHFCMHPTATPKQSWAFPTSGGASHSFE
jgi:hypothetical protein